LGKGEKEGRQRKISYLKKEVNLINTFIPKNMRAWKPLSPVQQKSEMLKTEAAQVFPLQYLEKTLSIP